MIAPPDFSQLNGMMPAAWIIVTFLIMILLACLAARPLAKLLVAIMDMFASRKVQRTIVAKPPYRHKK